MLNRESTVLILAEQVFFLMVDFIYISVNFAFKINNNATKIITVSHLPSYYISTDFLFPDCIDTRIALETGKGIGSTGVSRRR